MTWTLTSLAAPFALVATCLARSCAAGYDGPLCHTCEVDWDRPAGEQRCVPCTDHRYRVTAVIIISLGVILFFVPVLSAAMVRRRKRRCRRSAGALTVELIQHDSELTRLRKLTTHALEQYGDSDPRTIEIRSRLLQADRVARHRNPAVNVETSSASSSSKRLGYASKSLRAFYQPARILISFVQVIGEIGPVLNFEFPQAIRDAMSMLIPFAMNLRSLILLDCISHMSYYTIWTLQVFGLPSVLAAAVFAKYFLHTRKQTTDTSNALRELYNDLFVVVFLVYPSVCNHAFKMFDCRCLSAELCVLRANYEMLCYTSKHKLYKVVAFVVMVVFSFGVPVGVVVLMMRRLREYTTADKIDRFVARHVATELQTDDTSAMDAIRDVMMGRQYSFFVNAYKPRYYFWEGYDMVRKLLLVGMLTLAGQGSTAQLFVGICISICSFAAQIRCQPYKHAEDNWFKTAIEMQILLTMIVALVLKNIAGLAPDEVLLSRDFYDEFLTCAFIVLVPVCFVLTLLRKKWLLRHVLQYSETADDPVTSARQHALQMLQLGISSDADVELLSTFFDRVRASADRDFHAFISYRVAHDAEAARELYNRLSTLEIEETGQRLRVFLDQVCLEDGQRWDIGFASALSAVVFVPLVSVRCLQGMATLTPEQDRCDNVLLEWCVALELHQRGCIKAILPMLIGEPEFFVEAESALGPSMQGLPQHMSDATM
eukprot:SAG31_NODE_2629_length_5350_cov_2.286612_5_plen_713_part_01